MFRFIGQRVCSATLVALAACQDSGPAANFEDGSWIFQTDRVWTAPVGGVDAPDDALDEADYAPSETEPDWSIWVTGHRKALELSEVSSDAAPIAGTLGEPVGVRLHYELTDGTFAGGRFEVWDDGALRAELTLYGSGVPVVSSVRGALVRIVGL